MLAFPVIIFSKVFLPCLISLFAQTSTAVFSSHRWKLTPGFIYRSQRRLIFLSLDALLSRIFVGLCLFQCKAVWSPGSLFGLRHGKSSLFTLASFFLFIIFFSFVKGNFNYGRHRVYICFLVSWYYWNNLSLGVSLFNIQLWNSWRLMVLCTSGLSVWPFF